MIKEFQYVSIKEAVSRTLRHPLLQDINLEDTILYVIDFIGLHGLPKMYKDKEVVLHIKDYQALMPCDLVLINQIKHIKENRCLRSMSDTFNPIKDNQLLFKTQGRVLVTSFKEGDVLMSYKAIPVDEEGYPMLPDNSILLKCLDAYIKKEYFTILFDTAKINNAVMEKAEQNYCWLAGLLNSEFTIPSVSEMESIKNNYTSLLLRVNEFQSGFKNLGNPEYLRAH